MTREDLKNYRFLLAELEEMRLAKMATDRSLTEEMSDVLCSVYLRRREVYEKRLADLTAERERIESAVVTLPSRERRAITLHFFEGLTWEEVAEKMNYSEDMVKRFIQNKALRLLQNK